MTLTDRELSRELREHGLDDVLIGSYARDTGIWPGKDVDIFGKLDRKSVESIRPDVAYQLFLSALESRYAGRLTEQPRSIKIDFGPADERTPADEFLRERKASRADVFPFSVDVVPAVRSGDVWAIPSNDRGEWQRTAAAERWVRTDPEKLTDLTTKRNSELSIGGQGAFVPTVKAMRQVRRAHLGDAKPGGLYVELVLHEGFTVDDHRSANDDLDLLCGPANVSVVDLDHARSGAPNAGELPEHPSSFARLDSFRCVPVPCYQLLWNSALSAHLMAWGWFVCNVTAPPPSER